MKVKTKRSNNKPSKKGGWKKGDACVSNPQTKRYRDEVRRNRFAYGKSKAGLTATALAEHNDNLEDEDIDCSDDATSEKTTGSRLSKSTKAFSISGLTDCNNLTFQKVLKLWSSPTEQHKHVCAILAAVTEVIRAQGGKETEAEYFATLATALGAAEDEESRAAIVFLLSLVMKKLSPAVLRAKFSETSKTFTELLEEYSQGDGTSLLRNLISCLSTLLSHQDSVIWTESSTLKMYHTCLSFAVHSKPKVRKVAHVAIKSLLKLNLVNYKHHPAGTSTAKFCIQNMEKTQNSTTTLHILNLLKLILPFFGPEAMQQVCETVLKLLTFGNVMMKTNCLQTLHNLFESRPPEMNLPVILNGKIISALYDFQPSINDVQVAAAWLTVMESAHSNLSFLDSEVCLTSLPRFYAAAMAYMLSDFREVPVSATATMKNVIDKCLLPMHGEIIEQISSTENATAFHKIFWQIEVGMKYKYQPVWDLVLGLLSSFFEAFGKGCEKVMIKNVVTLCDLHESYNFPCLAELKKAVGMAIRTMGPRVIVEAVSLNLIRPDNKCEFPRSWLLPLMKDNIQQTELQFFISYFLPLAAKLREKDIASKEENQMLEAKVYETLQLQIWALLPGFCNNPTDLTLSFKNIARILGSALTERPDLRPLVLQSLRTLINKSTDKEEDAAELAKYGKNYLPILFNIYTSETEDVEKTLLPVLETIKTYLIVTDAQLISVFLLKAHDKLLEEASTGKKRYAVMDLLAIMVSYVDKDSVNKIHDTTIPLITAVDRTEQKKAYRILEEICDGGSDGCKQFVLENLDDLKRNLFASLSAAAPPAKAPRLRCLTSIVRKLSPEHKDFLTSILPEVILCTKAVGGKAKAAAFNLLLEIGNVSIYLSSESKEACVEEYLKLVMAGLGASSNMISATLIALTHLTREYKECLSVSLVGHLLSSGVDLLRFKSREVVKPALMFVKALIGLLNTNELTGHAQELIKNLFAGKDKEKNVLRNQTMYVMEKLVKKLGYEIVRSLVPEKHSKFISNIHKTVERRKKVQNEKRSEFLSHREEKKPKGNEDLDDLLSDSGDSDHEEKVERVKGKKGKSKTHKESKSWIMENDDDDAVDLLDPKMATRVVATEPLRKKRKSQTGQKGFAFSKDGKLVINEESEDKKSSQDSVDSGDLLPVAGKIPKKQVNLGKRKRDNDADDNKTERTYQPGGKGIHRPILKGKRKLPGKYGEEYKSKKAHGDIKIKGKPDPFAYIPLNRQKLNKRKQAKMAGQFRGIVQATKRSSLSAKKANRLKGQRR